MSYFDKSKKSITQKLERKDKSRKGDVDKDAEPVINALNQRKDYYTTSSCSGRISLFREAKSKKKHESGWLFVKHGQVTLEEIRIALKETPLDTVWFRQETPIFHVACRDIQSAQDLLKLCRDLGFKHSGIINIGRRVMVEIIFNEKIDCPVSENLKLEVSQKHLELLIDKANEKMKKNNELLKKFEEEIKKRLP